jgi:mono/diheme cytochrome c family protein
MKTIKIILLPISLLTVLICLTNCSEKKPVDTAKTIETKETDADIIKRGAYLVAITGCNDCHSPKKMGAQGPEIVPELQLSGYPAKRPLGKISQEAIKNGWTLFNGDLTLAIGPWGATFAANITSDATGIGNWSEEQFKKALTQGKYKGLDGGRMLLPPMPWVNYTTMKDEDIKAIFQYLKSTKPVNNIVPAPLPPSAG